MSGFLDILKAVAPTIATALGGPLAGAAISFLGDKLGVSEPTQEKIADIISGAKPEDLLKIKQLDVEFEEHMAQLGVDVFKIEAQDRESARQREMALKDSTPAHLAYMIIGGFFGLAVAQLVGIMMFPDYVAKIPPQGWVIVGNISGYLAAEAKAAAAYYFGTTASSKSKDATLAEIAKEP
jgi:hypothetical protein